MSDIQFAFLELKKYKRKLTRQQMKTLSGQLKSGNITGAMKGLNKILKRQGA